MFGIGIGELLIIFIVLLAIVTGIILLLRALLKSQGPSQNQSERLKELQKMKSEGLISEDEFSKKRNEIIGSI
ncbi:hypothetical protein ACFL6W_03745 [Thermodesulfobacteriota bacterium]